MSEKETIFSKLIKKEIPSTFLYEDEHCIVIDDISPQASVHMLVIPKKPLPRLVDASAEDKDLLGHLLLIANEMAAYREVADAFRIVINNGARAGQTVFHLHLHVLADIQSDVGFSETDMVDKN
jgi:histidine triad (HIT) family protein